MECNSNDFLYVHKCRVHLLDAGIGNVLSASTGREMSNFVEY
jgi:hypothetical protein